VTGFNPLKNSRQKKKKNPKMTGEKNMWYTTMPRRQRTPSSSQSLTLFTEYQDAAAPNLKKSHHASTLSSTTEESSSDQVIFIIYYDRGCDF